MSDSREGRCFELIFGYIHCTGRTEYTAGKAGSEAEAARWAEKRKGTRVKVPEEDPVRWCPVRHCHMKFQKPWFGYRK